VRARRWQETAVHAEEREGVAMESWAPSDGAEGGACQRAVLPGRRSERGSRRAEKKQMKGGKGGQRWKSTT
jgi:hypothetical protein